MHTIPVFATIENGRDNRSFFAERTGRQERRGVPMKLLQAVLTILLAFVVFTAAAQAEMSVGRAAVCTSIADREPVGMATSFFGVEQVYFFTEIKEAGENETIQHVWYHDDARTLAVDLAVSGPRWRTWSHKKVLGMKGPWRVEVVSSSGEVLRTVSFVIE
jgi:hypothetical protein